MTQVAELEWCPNCGDPVKSLNSYTGWCRSCSTSDPYIQLEDYLAERADHLEHYIFLGLTLRQAIRAVQTTKRPSCIVCGEVMNRAPLNALFCKRTNTCRQAGERYRYLYKRRPFTRSQALAMVIDQFNL